MILREFREDDLDAICAYESDAETMRFMPSGARSRQASLDYLRRSMRSAIEQPRSCFDLALVLRSSSSSIDGHLVGRVGVALQLEHLEAKLWYSIHRDHQSKGLVAEACVRLIDAVFADLKMHRVFVDIDPRNEPSLRVAEKLGFTREGRLRENFFCNGEWTDSLILGVLDHEWTELRRQQINVDQAE